MMDRHDVNTWTAEMQYLWAERAAIKIDSHIPADRAEEQAREEVWANFNATK